MRRWIIIAAVMLAAASAHAGEYELYMTDNSRQACSDEPDKSFNDCPPAIIVADIRNHLVNGKPFKYLAVKLAFDQCAISFSKEGRVQFYDGLIALLTDKDLKSVDRLIGFMSCFNYKSLRNRLEEALKQEQDELKRTRLRTALSKLQSWKR